MRRKQGPGHGRYLRKGIMAGAARSGNDRPPRTLPAAKSAATPRHSSKSLAPRWRQRVLRGVSKRRTRNLEIPGSVRSLSSGRAFARTRWDRPGMTEKVDEDSSGDNSHGGHSHLRAQASPPIALALMTSPSKSTFVLGHRHLLGIEGLSAADITGLLDLSEEYVELNRQIDKKRTSLRGRTQINLFFEASTRKGETLVDTAVTLNAMHPDILGVRHHASGAVELLARKVDGSVINAGD